MSLSLPKPGPAYDFMNETQARSSLELNDRDLQRKSQNIVINNRKFILTSPDGTQWYASISNTGTVTWTSL